MKTDKETTRKPLHSLTGGGGGGSDNIAEVIMHGITFKGSGKSPKRDDSDKVRTKAKKKGYITGAHGSGAAKKKADIHRARANRHKK